MEKIQECTENCISLFDDFSDYKKGNKVLSNLIKKSQKLLNEIGAGHPSIDLICKISEKYNLQSKLTGAGGGGCTITLLNNSNSENIEKFISEIKNEGFDCFKSMLGGPGLIFESF